MKIQSLAFCCLIALGCLLTSSLEAAETPYSNVVLASNPLIYYQFDETSGTIVTNSGSLGAANNGTVVSTVTLGESSFLQGGTAFDFGGGYVSTTAIPNSLTEWTVEAWVNWDSAKTTESGIFGNDQGGWNDDVQLGISPEGTGNSPASEVAIIQQGSPGSTRDTVSAPLDSGEWAHVVATGSTINDEINLYIDGVLVGTESTIDNGVIFNGADGIGTASIGVGATRGDGFRNFDGLIDEFAIYGTALDATTIQAHFAAGTTEVIDTVVPEPGSVLIWAVVGVGIAYLRRRIRKA